MKENAKSAEENQLIRVVVTLVITVVLIAVIISLQKRNAQSQTLETSNNGSNNLFPNSYPSVKIEQSILDFEQNFSKNSRDEAVSHIIFFQRIVEDVLANRYSVSRFRPNEKFFQSEFRLAWKNSKFLITPEVNYGRGPVDFIVSQGQDKTLIEFKMAKNFTLKSKKQVDIYKGVSNTENCLVAVFCYGAKEVSQVKRSIEKHNWNPKDVFIIDFSPKKSASKA